jgi:protein-L-isoaspartate(D-aspartate) O-methyltransferase
MAAGGPDADHGNGSEPDIARGRLADQLRDSERAGAAVEAAFRDVPRHLFLPEMAAARAYQDEAFAIKFGTDGLPLSSSSQPAIMAIMLEQLGLAPGQRVLEIGAGTGYNAALIAHIVGDQESIVTVDIDPEIVGRARAGLAAAGYGGVRVVCGDGGLGVAEHAPYDRIIITVGAWDIAPQWLAQLAPGGRIVLPLSIRGIQLSVALEQAGDHWASRSACRCGFIRMAGTLAGPETFVPLGPQPGLCAHADDAQALDGDALFQALSGDATSTATELRAAGMGELGDLDFWLTVTEPSLARLTLVGMAGRRASMASLMPLGGLARAGGGGGQIGVAALVPARGQRRPALSGLSGPASVPRKPAWLHERPASLGLVFRGFGPGGAELARYLARRALVWHGLGRPGAADIRISAYPSATGFEAAESEAADSEAAESGVPAPAPAPAAAPGTVVLRRRYTRLVLDWAAP